MIDSTLTSVTVQQIEGHSNFRVIFGDPHSKTPINSPSESKPKNLWFFKPGSIFCLDLFKRNQYGTTEWAVYVLQAAFPGETIVPVPQVNPGAKVLLEAHGKKRAQTALRELAEIQKRVDPTTLSPGRFLLTDFRLKADTRTRR